MFLEKLNPDTLPMIALHLSPRTLSNFIACSRIFYNYFSDMNNLRLFSTSYLQKWCPHKLKHLRVFIREKGLYVRIFYLKMICFYIIENRIDIDNILNTSEQEHLVAYFFNDRHIDFIKLVMKEVIHKNDILFHPISLSYAAKKGNFHICKILIQGQVNINYRGVHTGETALHNAVYYGHYNICKLLLCNGADINAKDAFNRTPLYCAWREKHQDIYKLLLENGAENKNRCFLMNHKFEKIDQDGFTMYNINPSKIIEIKSINPLNYEFTFIGDSKGTQCLILQTKHHVDDYDEIIQKINKFEDDVMETVKVMMKMKPNEFGGFDRFLQEIKNIKKQYGLNGYQAHRYQRGIRIFMSKSQFKEMIKFEDNFGLEAEPILTTNYGNGIAYFLKKFID